MPSDSGQPARCIAFFAAFLLIAVSASQNITHGWELGYARSAWHAAIFAAGSLGGALIQPFAFLAAFNAFRDGERGRGCVALALGLACVVYATVSSLGFAATAREAQSAERGSTVESHGLAKSRYQKAERELATLPLARPNAELQAMIDGVLSDPRAEGCTALNGTFTRTNCPKVVEWRAEQARGARRAELEAIVTAAEGEMTANQGVRDTDPQAAALSAYAAALGWTISADRIAPWLTVLAVFFFELGAAASLVVAHAVAGRPAQEPAPQVAAKVAEAPAALPEAQREASKQDDDHDDPPSSGKRGRKRKAPLGAVVQRLKDRGGTIEGSLNGIGKLIGTPAKTTTHRILRELEASGLIRLSSSPNGTCVALI